MWEIFEAISFPWDKIRDRQKQIGEDFNSTNDKIVPCVSQASQRNRTIDRIYLYIIYIQHIIWYIIYTRYIIYVYYFEELLKQLWGLPSLKYVRHAEKLKTHAGAYDIVLTLPSSPGILSSWWGALQEIGWGPLTLLRAISFM